MQALLVRDMSEAGNTSSHRACYRDHCCQAHCPVLTLQSQDTLLFNRNPPENRQNTAHSAVRTSTPIKLAVAPVGPTVPCYRSTTLALLAGAEWTKKPLGEYKVQKREGFVANSIGGFCCKFHLRILLQIPFYWCCPSRLVLGIRFFKPSITAGQSQSRAKNETQRLSVHLFSSQTTDTTQDATQRTESCAEQWGSQAEPSRRALHSRAGNSAVPAPLQQHSHRQRGEADQGYSRRN